jgi:hypothetical protein
VKFKVGDLVSIDSLFLELGFTELIGTIINVESSPKSGHTEPWPVYRVMLPSEGIHWFDEVHLETVSGDS